MRLGFLAAVLFLVSIENRKGRLAILLHHSCHLPPSFAFRFGESSIGFSIPAKSVEIDARQSLTLFAGHNASSMAAFYSRAIGLAAIFRLLPGDLSATQDSGRPVAGPPTNLHHLPLVASKSCGGDDWMRPENVSRFPRVGSSPK